MYYGKNASRFILNIKKNKIKILTANNDRFAFDDVPLRVKFHVYLYV